MKKRNLILSILVIVSFMFVHNVNAAFTDPDLEQCVNNARGTTELSQLTELNCSGIKAITDSTGLSQLTNLKKLNLSGTKVTSVNFDGLTKLEEVYIYDVDTLTTVNNLWELTNLKKLNLSNTGISGANNIPDPTNFKVDNLVNLTELILHDTNIGSISDLSKLTKLEKLDVGSTNIKVLNLTSNSKLKNLNAYRLGLTSLTLPSTCIIEFMNISQNYDQNVTSSTLTNSNFTNLNKCGNLKQLYMSGLKGITTLDLTNNTKLTDLRIAMTGIKTLTMPSNADSLKNVWAHDTSLTKINLKNFGGLTNLYINNNGFKGNKYKYVGETQYFNDPSSVVSLPSISKVSLVNSNDKKVTYNEAGVYNKEVSYTHAYGSSNYASSHYHNCESGSCSGTSSNYEANYSFTIDFKVYVLQVTSDKYKYHDELWRDFIYVGKDDNATILGNLNVTEGGYLKIDGNTLQVCSDSNCSEGKVVHEIALVRFDPGQLKTKYRENGSLSYSDIIKYISYKNADVVIKVGDKEYKNGTVSGYPLKVQLWRNGKWVYSYIFGSDGSETEDGTIVPSDPIPDIDPLDGGSNGTSSESVTNPKTGIVYPLVMVLVLGGVAAGTIVITKKTKKRKLIK